MCGMAVAKVAGWIDIGWVWILSPVWVLPAIAIAALCLLIAFAIILVAICFLQAVVNRRTRV